jgi:hypothetical protein
VQRWNTAGFNSVYFYGPGGALLSWNSMTGVTPVKKFTDRKAATARI